ncbi:hypothetical protein JTY60_01745 [symbiont of Argiope bruennichi]|uniref:hypothetical protein n=1 Tax=symbiont of Argiope bruennichi TaxID=2810479 RepID=UPI003DA67393
MKNNQNVFDLSTYFIDKLNLNNLSIEELQYKRKFCLNALYLSYLDELLKSNVFGFQKNNCKNVYWKEYYFWKNFYFPTFDYTLVYARDIFKYKQGNIFFSAVETHKRNRRFDKKEWKNKYLLKSWWEKNDDKLYIEENDKFSYLPDDVIKNNFTKANYGDLLFTYSLPFGKISFLKTSDVFLSRSIVIFKNNNEKIYLNLFFYYFFKGNSYLFENNAGNGFGSYLFTKWGFDASWMIIPTNLYQQANYIKMFYELEKQISLLIKIRRKSRNILHFLGKNCLDDKTYKLSDLVEKRRPLTITSTDFFDWLKYPRANHLRHTVFPWRTITAGYQWTKINKILYSDLAEEINLKKTIYRYHLNDLIIPKIYSKTSNPFLVDRINLYAFSTDYQPLFSKLPEVSTHIILWSILGQNFYQKYANLTKRGTSLERFDPKRFFKKELKLIKPKYYRITEHLSNVYNFCAKNISKYTKLREEISRLLQDPAVIEDETYEKHLQDMFLLSQAAKETNISSLNQKVKHENMSFLEQENKENVEITQQKIFEESEKDKSSKKKWWKFWK